jgi:hypothetical protein
LRWILLLLYLPDSAGCSLIRDDLDRRGVSCGYSGCVWFVFLGEPGSPDAGEWRLIACTAPRARFSGCIFFPLACIPRNGRFCRARLGSCNCFSH